MSDLDGFRIPFDLTSRSWLINGRNFEGVRLRILSSMELRSIRGAPHPEDSSLLSVITDVACCDPVLTLAIVTLESEAIEDEDGVNEDGVDGVDDDGVDDDVGDTGITEGSGVSGESLTRAEFATCAYEGSSTSVESGLLIETFASSSVLLLSPFLLLYPSASLIAALSDITMRLSNMAEVGSTSIDCDKGAAACTESWGVLPYETGVPPEMIRV